MVIIIAGPTACGKSEVSLHLALQLNAEIISADSMQVYKHFTIGTAKPLQEARKKVPHHLIDIISPDEEYNASLFRADAESICREIESRGRMPLIVGGSGLYIKAYTDKFICGVKADREVRKQLEGVMQKKGILYMYELLEKRDPLYAKMISSHDQQRIIRALEVQQVTGKLFSSYRAEQSDNRSPVKFFVLQRDRSELYKRIEDRVDVMFDQGLVKEVEIILEMGYKKDLKPFQSIGYSQALAYLQGEISFDTCVSETRKETRRYAKRQITWFKKIPSAIYLSVDDNDSPEEVANRLKEILTA